MTNKITATFTIKIKDEFKDSFLSGLAQLTKETSSFPGCLSIRPVQQTSNSNVVLFIEEWGSIEDFDLYMAWRSERGDMNNLSQILFEAPQVFTWHAAL